MALYDVLQKRVQAQRASAMGTLGASAQDATSSILGAKTGKAAPAGVAPKASSLQEGAATDAAALAIDGSVAQASLGAQDVGAKENALAADKVAQQTKLDAERRAAETALAAQATGTRESLAQKQDLGLESLNSKEQMQIDKLSSDAEQRIANLLSEKKINEDQIFTQYSQDNRELAFRRDAASLEQMATTLALRDKSYLNEITAIGTERNLKDDIDFQKETTRLIMGEEVSSVLNQIGFGEEQMADQMAFERRMAQLSINDAIALMEAQIKAGQTQQAIQGITGMASAAVDYQIEKGEAAKAAEKQSVAGIKAKEDAYVPSNNLAGETPTFNPNNV